MRLNSATVVYMKEIPLTRGYVATVDDEDFEAVAALKWFACISGKRVYAMRLWRHPKGSPKSHGHTYMHRLVSERMGLDGDGLVIDHIDGNTLDNRRSNLRVVTVRENIRNQQGSISTSKHGTPGIVKRTETRWEAWIRDGNVRKRYLGSFKTKELAVEARLKAEKEIWGVQPRRAWEHKS